MRLTVTGPRPAAASTAALFDLSDAVLKERPATLLATYLPGTATYELHQNDRTNERAAELVAGPL